MIHWKALIGKKPGKTRMYMDYAAATPVCKDAATALCEAQGRFWGNPGGLHTEGTMASEALADARKRIAAFLGCRASQVIITSGGTEGNNLAIGGLIRAHLQSQKQAHIVVSAIEHPSILEPVEEAKRMGVHVTYVQPNAVGIIKPEAIRAALTPHTVLVSVGWVNSEIGTIQPMHAISQVVRAYEKESGTRIYIHTDAGQGPLYVSPNVHGLGVDLMTLDSGKLYGPRGTGMLFVRDRQSILPILFGGGQERGLRPGSENVALVMGCAAALEWIERHRGAESERLSHLKTLFIQRLSQHLPDLVVNGDQRRSSPHIVNISIPHIHSEYLMFSLDYAGVAVSTKSSCREGTRDSHVVAALCGGGEGEAWRASHTLRFSFGTDTQEADVEAAVERTVAAVHAYRGLETGTLK